MPLACWVHAASGSNARPVKSAMHARTRTILRAIVPSFTVERARMRRLIYPDTGSVNKRPRVVRLRFVDTDHYVADSYPKAILKIEAATTSAEAHNPAPAVHNGAPAGLYASAHEIG